MWGRVDCRLSNLYMFFQVTQEAILAALFQKNEAPDRANRHMSGVSYITDSNLYPLPSTVRI